jgi:hypothetical protein
MDSFAKEKEKEKEKRHSKRKVDKATKRKFFNILEIFGIKNHTKTTMSQISLP